MQPPQTTCPSERHARPPARHAPPVAVVAVPQQPQQPAQQIAERHHSPSSTLPQLLRDQHVSHLQLPQAIVPSMRVTLWLRTKQQRARRAVRRTQHCAPQLPTRDVSSTRPQSQPSQRPVQACVLTSPLAQPDEMSASQSSPLQGLPPA